MNDVLNRALYQYSRLTSAEQKRLTATVIESGRLSSIDGPYVRELERQVADRLVRCEAIATCTATAALELTLRALDIGPGHEVVIPEFGWVSVGAVAAATGATVRVAPITADLAPTWSQIEPLIRPTTKAVILAHMRGTLAPDVQRVAAELDRARITLSRTARRPGVCRPQAPTAVPPCSPPSSGSSSRPVKEASSPPTTSTSR